MAAFLSNVQQQRRSGRYPAAMIGNMDETPVYFDLIPNKTIDRVGTKSCIVRSTGSEKRHITVVLTVRAIGCMLPPMIIFKGKRALKLNVPEGVVVAVQEKAWMDQKLVEDYIRHIWMPYVEKTSEQLGLPDRKLY